MDQRKGVKMFLRVPTEVKEWIEREAERDDRPQNSVVVRTLRSRMDEDERQEKAAR